MEKIKGQNKDISERIENQQVEKGGWDLLKHQMKEGQKDLNVSTNQAPSSLKIPAFHQDITHSLDPYGTDDHLVIEGASSHLVIEGYPKDGSDFSVDADPLTFRGANRGLLGLESMDPSDYLVPNEAGDKAYQRKRGSSISGRSVESRNTYTSHEEAPTQNAEHFSNIHQVEISKLAQGEEIALRPGKYEYIVSLANPQFIIARRTNLNSNMGHSSLVRGEKDAEVFFAGNFTIDQDKKLAQWDNWSGHYRCQSPDAEYVGLPMEKFKSVRQMKRENTAAMDVSQQKLHAKNCYIDSMINQSELSDIVKNGGLKKESRRSVRTLIANVFKAINTDTPKKYPDIKKKEIEERVVSMINEMKDTRFC